MIFPPFSRVCLVAAALFSVGGVIVAAQNASSTVVPGAVLSASPASHEQIVAEQKQAEARFATLAPFRAQLAANTGIKLVAIPAGTFLMGSPADEPGRRDDEGPQTRVTLTDDFLLGATEVTQRQYEAVMGNNPSDFKAAGLDAPVERLSVQSAKMFCQKLTEREQAAGYLPDGYAFALPTEAQWEYACRAGTTGANSGDLDAMAWYSKNSNKTTHPVGLKQPNAWGLYDIYGNVEEWCADSPLNYAGGNVTNPVGPIPNYSNKTRLGNGYLARGGCWDDVPTAVRSAYRKRYPGYIGRFIGFRLALVKVSTASIAQMPAPASTNKPPAAPPPPPVRRPVVAINREQIVEAQKQAEARAAALADFRAKLAADLGLKLVAIPAGHFTMGSAEDEPDRGDDEGPATQVTLTRDFLLGATDVTQGQYQAVMGTNPSDFKTAGPNAPVESVSFADALAFCRKLTDRERAAGNLPAGYAFTLPTEAQWEYACRAGTTDAFAGDPAEMSWYGDNSEGKTHPVATKLPNNWGLYDMSGNVYQWCLDWYGKYPGGAVQDWTGPATGKSHVLRGGSWYYTELYCRSAYRDFDPNFVGNSFGFRVALVQVVNTPVVAPLSATPAKRP